MFMWKEVEVVSFNGNVNAGCLVFMDDAPVYQSL